MLRMKLLDPDPAGMGEPRTIPSLPLTFTLADDTQLTVWVTDLKTRVVNGVLTATGTATLPGHDSDTFTAQVRADETSSDRLAVTLAFGWLKGDPFDFTIDVSHVVDGIGAVRAAPVFGLLNQLYASRGS